MFLAPPRVIPPRSDENLADVLLTGDRVQVPHHARLHVFAIYDIVSEGVLYKAHSTLLEPGDIN